MPLSNKSYGQQLQLKYKHMQEVLKNLGIKLAELNAPYKLDRNGLPCPLELVKPSPITEQYRNKDEFSVWPDLNGNTKAVGFIVGKSSVHQKVICVPPDKMIITRQSHIDLAKKFEDYLRQVSPYDSCQNYGLDGHWRRIVIRSNYQQEHMVIAIMHPQQLNETMLKEEMDRLAEFFKEDERIKSLYFHTSCHTRSTNTKELYYHIAGDKVIKENLFNKQFTISPSSFFQVNTSAAEVLYRNVMTELNLNKKTILLDLCCGTGILATLLSDNVKKVIGIDSSASAIEDAKRNAQDNNVHNVEFINGTIEEVLPRLVQDRHLERSPIVAVVNPTRRALHPSTIKFIRNMDYIQRLVYVSCKADGDASYNFLQLCNPNIDDKPFMPINAIPVDLFPHTTHCELIVTFDRTRM